MIQLDIFSKLISKYLIVLARPEGFEPPTTVPKTVVISVSPSGRICILLPSELRHEYKSSYTRAKQAQGGRRSRGLQPYDTIRLCRIEFLLK